MLARWPIKKKLLAALVLLMVIVGTLSWSGLHGLYAYRRLVKDMERRLEVLPRAAELNGHTNNLRVALSEMRSISAERRYATTLDDSSPLNMWLAREEFRQQLGDVKQSLQRYREALENLQGVRSSLRDSTHEWENVREIEKALVRIDEVNRDADWLLDQVKVGHLYTELDTLQQLTGALPKLLHKEIDTFLLDVRNQYRALIVLAWATAVLTVSLLIVFGVLAYRWIFRPIRMLVKGSRKVADGRFDYRISIGTKDEMQELANAMNDMTDRFRSIRDDLDHQVRERTRQVIRNEQLASVGYLAAGVAHEINNPLASISFCAEAIEKRSAEILNSENPDHAVVQTYLRMIQEEAFRCKGITEQLLDFSRLGEVRRQPTEMRELVQGMMDLVRHMGKYGGKQVNLAPGDAVYALANSQEMKQVVLNLLTNALDSVDEQGQVSIELSPRHGQAELVFTDNGCGMTDDVREHLFEPFFTTKRTGQGTGLGLSICYRIVADHGGQIEVQSAGPGQGSRFRVTLPLAAFHVKETEHRYQAA
ncbi:MAG: sensor histidine kinase [Pirellulales bacterium]